MAGMLLNHLLEYDWLNVCDDDVGLDLSIPNVDGLDVESTCVGFILNRNKDFSRNKDSSIG